MACSSEVELLEEEVECIESILMEALHITRNAETRHIERIGVQLHPLTATDEDAQYVKVTLVLHIEDGYPHHLPRIQVHMTLTICLVFLTSLMFQMKEARGLSEMELSTLSTLLHSKALSFQGHAMLFELIEATREFITEHNCPKSDCPICLMPIVDEDKFVKTICYHYFHALCMAHYISHLKNDVKEQSLDNQESVPCPVCRESMIETDMRLQEWMEAEKPVMEFTEQLQLTSKLKESQRAMNELFVKQKKKGSIIDVEQEEKRFLLTTETSILTANVANNSHSNNGSIRSSSPMRNEATNKETRSYSMSGNTRSKDMSCRSKKKNNRTNKMFFETPTSIERSRRALESFTLDRTEPQDSIDHSRRDRGQRGPRHVHLDHGPPSEGRGCPHQLQRRRGRGSRGGPRGYNAANGRAQYSSSLSSIDNTSDAIKPSRRDQDIGSLPNRNRGRTRMKADHRNQLSNELKGRVEAPKPS